ncbi:MAG: hypothetical protein KA170_12045 [Candidatus Promineofilum sp.]|jgi:hypothetical protein|nr:hypothetical protein [Promineifilum sp.]
MKRLLLLLGLLLVVALAACEDTTVHTTPPAPIDSAGTPTLTIDPPTIGPNTPITVTGQGFPAGVVVELTVQRITESFTTDPLGQGQTDDSGNVTIEAQVPALWLDGTPLNGPELTLELATEDGDVRGVATVPFEGEALVNFLAIIPASGAPGQEVQLQGIGFEPGQEIAVRLGQSADDLLDEEMTRVTVGNDGSFQERIAIPLTWADSGEAVTEASLIVALVDVASGEVLATASFSNDPAQAAPEGNETPAP